MHACAPNERPTDTETHAQPFETYKTLKIVGCQNAGPTASSSVYIYIYIHTLCIYIYTHVFACTSIPTVLTNTQVCVHVVLCVSVKPRVLGHVHLADLMRQQKQHTLTNRHGIKHRSNQTNKQANKQTHNQPSNTHKQTKQIETNTQPIKQHKPTNKHTYKQTNSLTLTLTLVQMSAVNAPQHCVDPSLIAKQRH